MVLFHKAENFQSPSYTVFLAICSSLQILKFKYRVAIRRSHWAPGLSHKPLHSLLESLGVMTSDCTTLSNTK